MKDSIIYFLRLFQLERDHVLWVGLTLTIALSTGFRASAQVRGRVVDDTDGSGLPGATILVSIDGVGTVTDYEGNFTLDVNPGTTLTVSFIGYKKSEVITSSEFINIRLQPDIDALDEVVVIGYGTQKRSDITGSVASIRTEDLNPGPVVSVSNFLQNTAPGVVLTQSSAQPGGGFDIKIRGASSVLGGNGPLYVIDGLPITGGGIQPGSSSRYRTSPPRNPLNGINPRDIVSLEILKDASATSIYGARGANGVVLITTKRGSSGKMTVDYSGSSSIQELDRRYEMLDASEFARVTNEVYVAKNPTASPIYTPVFINSAGKGTNWIDQITRLGSIQQHQVGLTGSLKDVKYYVSGNYFLHNGIVDGSQLERFTTRANVDYAVKKWKLSGSVLLSRTNDAQIPFGGGGGPEFAGLFDNTRLWSPLLNPRQDNGEFSLHPVRVEIPNPLSLLDIEDDTRTNRVLTSFTAEYNLTSSLSAKVNFGLDQSSSIREGFIPTTVIRGEQANGEGEISNAANTNILTELTLNYQKTIADGHELSALVGYTYQQFDYEGDNFLFFNFADQTTDFERLTDVDTLFDQNFKERSRLLSYLARVNYTIKDKYLFTASFRADGSTRFGPNNKWGYFPSGAFAWKIHNEDFFDSRFIEQLKLRISYGQIGNQEIGNKRSQSLYNITRRTVFGQNPMPITGLAALRPDNPNLRWETTSQLNIGIDFALLKSRIYGSIDIYEKITNDVLLDFQLPGTSGFEVVTTNAGSIRNRGYELALTSRNIVGGFSWTTSFNLAFNQNQWRDRSGFYPEGEQIAVENGPLGGIYGYQVAGLFQSEDEINNSPDQSAVAIPVPGTFRYEDANGDGVITPEDRVLLGQFDPDYTLGLNNALSYKNLDLTFFFQGSIGREKVNYTLAYLEDADDITEGFNKSVNVLGRWTSENPEGTIPGIDGIVGGISNNSHYIENASFVRLRNVTLGYNFNDLKWASNLRIYADAQNLITITPYSGTDPETDEFRQYPNAKTYTLGLNITF
ncbi:MAG: TonB-dependent receptor [Cyclobacteriaceae bacterium]